MNNQEIKNIVTKQLAFDLNCQLEDFFDKNKAVNNHAHKKRRYFYSDEHKFLHAININQNVIVACDDRIKPWIRNLIKTISGYRFFDSIQLNVINKELKKYHQQVGMIGEYFLPDVDKIIVEDINFRYEILKDKQILKLYKDKRFPMALMYKAEKKRKDNMAIVAYTKDNNIMGVAGSTLDSDIMCSIGIDVIDNY